MNITDRDKMVASVNKVIDTLSREIVDDPEELMIWLTNDGVDILEDWLELQKFAKLAPVQSDLLPKPCMLDMSTLELHHSAGDRLNMIVQLSKDVKVIRTEIYLRYLKERRDHKKGNDE